MAGALGTLGAITEVSFKVLPRPVAEVTLSFAMDEARATSRRIAGRAAAAVVATAWLAGRLLVRLSGAASAVRPRARRWAARRPPTCRTSGRAARSPHRVLRGSDPLWRLSVPQTAAPIDSARRRSSSGAVACAGCAARSTRPGCARQPSARGPCNALPRRRQVGGVFHPLAPAILKIHRRLKSAFDPAGILNPGRMYDF
jgi:glycolate oxidase FAD binding subunit